MNTYPTILTPEDEPHTEEEMELQDNRVNAVLSLLMRTIYTRAGVSEEMVHPTRQRGSGGSIG